MEKTHIVILGGGYGGLSAALELDRLLKNRQDYRILLIDGKEDHQVKADLHLVAAERKTEKAITIPFRKILQNRKIEFMRAEVLSIDFAHKNVLTTEGKVRYDKLVIALGSETEYFGIPGLKEHALTLTSIDDALRIRNHIRDMFAKSVTSSDEKNSRAMLTFVVGGGGFTGVELATELTDYIAKLAEEAKMDRDETRLIVVEAEDTILPGFDIKLADRVIHVLESRGIELMLRKPVVAFDGNTVQLRTGEKIDTKTLIWTGGVRSNAVAADSGLETGSHGRIVINPFSESVDYAGVYAIGDNSLVLDPSTSRPLAPTGQLTLQQAKIAAFNIYAELMGKRRKRFTPHIVGQFVCLGRREAAGWVWKFSVFGFFAWFLKQIRLLMYFHYIGGLKLMLARLPQLFA